MDKDLISVIMPAYNAEKHISASIESVFDQSYDNWELIVIDDGSTDHTADIIKQYANKNPRVKYYYQQNGKQGKARNYGIRQSNADYIAFLDADDIWMRDKLNTQLNVLLANEYIDLVFSQGYYLSGDKRENCNTVIQELWAHGSLPQLITNNQIPILSVLVKKKVLLQVEGFTENPAIQNAEDYHLWLKLLLSGAHFTSIPDRLFDYRIHENQSTFQNSNLAVPHFNVYEDVYNWTKNETAKKLIINKLKWYLFQNEFRSSCIRLFSFHLAQKGNRMLAMLLERYLDNPSIISRRLVFKIITAWG